MKIERKEIQAAYLFVAILGQPPSPYLTYTNNIRLKINGLFLFSSVVPPSKLRIWFFSVIAPMLAGFIFEEPNLK